jgi:hypothetical protein
LKSKTEQEYDAAAGKCRALFEKKNRDYGNSWRILRPASLTDQIFIKAQRVRTLEEKKNSKVGEGVEPEYIGIINYCLIALIQLKLGSTAEHAGPDELLRAYDQELETTRNLMMAKNHDYGEAWRDMRIETYTDMILMKVLRIREIENHNGETLVSEGIDANYRDMINYAIFALIRLNEKVKD